MRPGGMTRAQDCAGPIGFRSTHVGPTRCARREFRNPERRERPSSAGASRRRIGQSEDSNPSTLSVHIVTMSNASAASIVESGDMPVTPRTFVHPLRASTPTGAGPATVAPSRHLLIDIVAFALLLVLSHSTPGQRAPVENLVICTCLSLLAAVVVKTWNRARLPGRLRTTAGTARTRRVLDHRETLAAELAQQLRSANDQIRDLRQELDRAQIDQAQLMRDNTELKHALCEERAARLLREGGLKELQRTNANPTNRIATSPSDTGLRREGRATVSGGQPRPASEELAGSPTDLRSPMSPPSSQPDREPGGERR